MPEGSGYYVNKAIREAVGAARDSAGDTIEVDPVTYNTFMRHKNAYNGVTLSFRQHDDAPTTPEGNSSGSRLGTVYVAVEG